MSDLGDSIRSAVIMFREYVDRHSWVVRPVKIDGFGQSNGPVCGRSDSVDVGDGHGRPGT